jgi:hypothetical protein
MHDLTREVIIDGPMKISMSFVDRFCTRLSIALEPLLFSGIAYQEVHTWITPRIEVTLGRSIQLKQFISHLLKNRQISGYLGEFLLTSFVPLHHAYSVFCEGKNRVNWSVSVLREDRSFFVTYGRAHSVNFLLKKGLLFQVIVATKGKSSLFQIPLDALARSRDLPRMSYLTHNIQMHELGEFKKVVEQFFDCRDQLVEIGFTGFLLSDGEFSATYTRAPGGLRLRCILKDITALFEVEGDGDIAKAVRHLLAQEFGSPLVQIAVARFTIGLFDLDPTFLAVVVHFFTAMAIRSSEMEIDWAQSMAGSAVLALEHRALVQIVADAGLLSVEFTKVVGDRALEIRAMDANGAGAKFRTVKDLVKWVDSTRRS